MNLHCALTSPKNIALLAESYCRNSFPMNFSVKARSKPPMNPNIWRHVRGMDEPKWEVWLNDWKLVAHGEDCIFFVTKCSLSQKTEALRKSCSIGFRTKATISVRIFLGVCNFEIHPNEWKKWSKPRNEPRSKLMVVILGPTDLRFHQNMFQ